MEIVCVSATVGGKWQQLKRVADEAKGVGMARKHTCRAVNSEREAVSPHQPSTSRPPATTGGWGF